MKKILVLTVVLLQTLVGFSQSDNLLDQFVGSSEYSRVKKILNNNFGEIDYQKSNIEYTDGDQLKPVINIVLSSGSIIKGVIKSIPLLNSQHNVLPNDERFIMSLVDYRDYNISSKTGYIKVIDLNYDNHISLELTVNNSAVDNVNLNDLPESIKSRYSSLLKKRDLGNPIYRSGEERNSAHFCDLNGNGNVSWSECFTCMVRACSSSQECTVLCGLTNVAGAYVGNGGAGACTVSMATACVYLSIKY